MGRKKKDSVTRCFNIDSKIFNLLEHLTEDGFLTLTQAIEKSIKGRYIHEFGQDAFDRMIGKGTTKETKIIKETKIKNEIKEIKSEQEIAIEFQKLKEQRRKRKLGDLNE